MRSGAVSSLLPFAQGGADSAVAYLVRRLVRETQVFDQEVRHPLNR
jgi:hypothetical protein